MQGFVMHLGQTRLTASASRMTASAARPERKSRLSDLPDDLRGVDLHARIAAIVAAGQRRPDLRLV